jgi:hypothetical protein
VLCCHPVNCTGHPAASVPGGASSGLSVGMQIIGRRYADGDMFAVRRGWRMFARGLRATRHTSRDCQHRSNTRSRRPMERHPPIVEVRTSLKPEAMRHFDGGWRGVTY